MLLIKNGTVYSMASDPFIGDVLIDNGRILSVGPGISIPSGTSVLNAAGKFVLPGFIDAHCHIGMFDDGMGE